MRVSIYGAVVVRPISFPDDLRLFLFPLRRKDDSHIGDKSWPMEEHRSWEWVRKRYVPAPIVEKQLENGESVTLTMGPTVVDLRDGTEFPEGCEYRILD
jgi:hypothetical protein